PPTSHVAPLPTTLATDVQPPRFTVSWSGQDASGSGIAAFDIYVSDNGAAFTRWLTGTKQTSATCTGVFGHPYALYSVATDSVGHREATPAGAQASTLLVLQGPPKPQVRPISARLVTVKSGKRKKMVVQVFFTDTGEMKKQFISPYQSPAFRNIKVKAGD